MIFLTIEDKDKSYFTVHTIVESYSGSSIFMV